MPIKDGGVYCVNHKDTIMARNAGFSAITALESGAEGLIFHGNKGIPIVVFMCNVCGYIETYAASKTPFWSELMQDQGRKLPEKSRAFEAEVFKALESSRDVFRTESMQFNGRLNVDSREREVDAIIRARDAVYIFEVKMAGSPGVLALAATRLRDIVGILSSMHSNQGDRRPIRPVLIVPSGLTHTDQVGEIPVLRYNSESRRFENAEAVVAGFGT